MAKFPTLKVEKRTLIGRKVKQLRRQGIIPANLFGHGIESIAIQAPEAAVVKLFREVGETNLIEVHIDDNKYPALFSALTTDPTTGKLLHVDIHHVSLKEKVTATIAIEIIGESPAVKDLGAVLSQSLHEVDVEALPTELPESIQVDVSSLAAIGDMITVADLKVSSGVSIQAEPDTAVLSIIEQKVEEVTEEAPVETETTKQGPTSEAGADAEAAK